MELGKFDKAAFEAAKNRRPAPATTDAVQAALAINWRLTPVMEKRNSETKAARALARN